MSRAATPAPVAVVVVTVARMLPKEYIYLATILRLAAVAAVVAASAAQPWASVRVVLAVVAVAAVPLVTAFGQVIIILVTTELELAAELAVVMLMGNLRLLTVRPVK